MSIEQPPGAKLLISPMPPAWGELLPSGERSVALRLVLPDRVVTFPWGELRRWEHRLGEVEVLVIHAGQEEIRIEGKQLQEVRAALDWQRLLEVRVNSPLVAHRPGSVVRRIAVEPRAESTRADST